MMKRILAILLALAMLLSVSAVFAEAEETAAEPVSVPDTLLATVRGQEIRENNEKLQSYLSDILSSAGSEDEATLHIARMYAMSYILQEAMLSEKLDSIDPAEAEAARQQAKEDWENVLTQFMAQMSGITEESSEEEIKEYVKTHMAKHKIPRYVDFVDGFPMNAAGKILKYKMREEAVERHGLENANKIVTA